MEFISYKDTSVRLSGRWDTERFGAAVTTAPGGTIELAFCGTCAVLHFDTDWNEHPCLLYTSWQMCSNGYC